MSLILHIDTAQEEASVALSHNNQLLKVLYNNKQKDHASFVQPAIQKIIQQSTYNIKNIQAVSVIAGPGSYTGLRVGLASAKGLCYALQIPLITLNTLEVMAYAVINSVASHSTKTSALYCPMIDARRNEVFMAVYDNKLNVIIQPAAIILNQESFMDLRKSHELVFFGSGSSKWNSICKNNAMILDLTIKDMTIAQHTLAYICFQNRVFADIAYTEPCYIKDFYNPVSKNP